MQVARRLVIGGFVAVLAACGSEGVTEPGALTLTLNGPPPSVTNAATLQITGQVTRTPAAPGEPIVVTATGGPTAASDTAAADGSFALSVSLTANAQNNLTISAADASGSSGTPVSVAVRHDNQPPQVSSMTPANESDGVTPSSIDLVFGEPVVPGSPVLTISRYGVIVPGAATLSGDSLTLSFTPTAALEANTVHVVTVTGVRDALGNTLSTGGGCFATDGAPAAFTDPAADDFQDGTPPASLVRLDVLGARFARHADTLHGIVRFSATRSLDPNSGRNVSAWIDIVGDQNGATGFITAKDRALSGILPASGAGAEFVIEFGTFLQGPAGGMIAQYTTQDTLQLLQEFSPTACGSVVGFAVPLAAISEDGAFDVVGYFDAFDGQSGTSYFDPAPDSDVYSVALTAAAGVAPSAVRWSSGPAFVVPRWARFAAKNR